MRILDYDDAGNIFYMAVDNSRTYMTCAFASRRPCNFTCTALQPEAYSTEERGQGTELVCLRLESLAFGQINSAQEGISSE